MHCLGMHTEMSIQGLKSRTLTSHPPGLGITVCLSLPPMNICVSGTWEERHSDLVSLAESHLISRAYTLGIICLFFNHICFQLSSLLSSLSSLEFLQVLLSGGGASALKATFSFSPSSGLLPRVTSAGPRNPYPWCWLGMENGDMPPAFTENTPLTAYKCWSVVCVW